MLVSREELYDSEVRLLHHTLDILGNEPVFFQ